MFHEKHCKHRRMGMLGMAALSTAMTLPLIYYAMDIAHSLRTIAHDSDYRL